MGTVRYTVVDGEILSELRDGVKRDYVPDPLGSTVALLDSTQTITDTFSYWPYGESAGRTGTTPTPFQYVGTMGYYNDSSSRSYVRARYLDKGKGRWITEDTIEFSRHNLNLNIYAKLSPIQVIDFNGNWPANYTGPCNGKGKPPVPRVPCPPEVRNAKNKLCGWLMSPGTGLVQTGCLPGGPSQATCLRSWCIHDTPIYCSPQGGEFCQGNRNPQTGVTPTFCAFELAGGPTGISTIPHPECPVFLCISPGNTPVDAKKCGYLTANCDGTVSSVILHELIGVCGSAHYGGNIMGDPCNDIADCLCRERKKHAK